MWGRLPGMDAFVASAVSETPLPPKGWLPIGASWQQGQLYARWSYFGEQRLREPFFEGDVQRSLSKPFNRLFRACTRIEKLAGWLRENPPLRPRGMSRRRTHAVSRRRLRLSP